VPTRTPTSICSSQVGHQPRVLPHQSAQDGQHVFASDMGGCRNPYRAAGLGCLGGGGIEQAIDRLQRRLRMRREIPPVVRDLHAARVAMEQRLAQGRLQLAHGTRDGLR
jgi:hypothetical protein